MLLVAKAQVKVGVMRQRMRPALGNVDAPAGLKICIVCLNLLTPTEPMPGVSIAGHGQSLWLAPLSVERVGSVFRLEPFVWVDCL